MMKKDKSLRSRLLDLEVNQHFKVVGTRYENTLRNYASTIGNLTGRKFSVMKQGTTSVTVFRYE